MESDELNYQYPADDLNYGISYEEESKEAPIEFDAFIESLKSETENFQALVISSGIALISAGILLNLIFNLIVICRNRRRHTSTTIIMLSMSLAYMLFLSFYAFKVSVYLEGNNITKFHMYEIIDNWTHGQFLCRFISGLPVFVKLIVRLSILAITIKRLFKAFDCDCSQGLQNEDEQDMLNDLESDISKQNEYGMNYRQTERRKSSINYKKPKKSTKKFRFILAIFEWPSVLILILAIWIISFGATLPLFSSYTLNESNEVTSAIKSSNSMCKSVYTFPEELDQVRSLYFNYLIYGLVVPCAITMTCLLILSIIQTCTNKTKTNESSKQNQTSGDSSRSSTSSFSESSSHNQSCSRSNGNSNRLIWFMLFVHLATSLPQELYRHYQLSADFNNKAVLDEYLTSSLMEPIAKARPYYAFQLLCLAECVVMPCLFLLFAICSMKRNRPTRSESDSEMNKKKCQCSPGQSSYFKAIRNAFYDSELSQSKKSGSFLKIDRGSSKPANQHVFLPVDQKEVDEPQTEAKFPQVTESSTSPGSYAQCNNNIMHIIQHPSWRINIKQQNHPISDNRSPSHQQQPQMLHFNYVNQH